MRHLLTFILVGLIFATNVNADDEFEKDRSELKSLLNEIVIAINTKDIDLIMSKLHDDVVVTFLNAEVARGTSEVRNYFTKTLGADNAILSSYRTQASESSPADIYGSIALADGTANDEFIFKDGSVMTINTQWTTALVKKDDQWKILKLHFSTNVFDNPVLAAAESSLYVIGIIALIIGLVVGVFVGRKTVK